MASHFARPQIIPHQEASVDFTLFDCHWVPCSTRFVVLGCKLSGEGRLCVYSMGAKALTQLAEAPLRPKSLKCATFGASSLEDRHLATGDFGGGMDVWDLEELARPVWSVKAHEEIVNAIAGAGGLGGGGGGAPEIATASRDGCVKVWDVRVPPSEPVACIRPKSGEAKRDAWAVAFGNDASDSSSDRLLAAGYDNGDVKLFDLRSMSVHYETSLAHGVCSLELDRAAAAKNKLVAAGLEGRMRVLDLKTKHETQGYAELDHKHEKATLWAVRHLPQNRDVFVTAGGSGALTLWKYDYPDKRAVKEQGDGDAMVGVAGKLSKLQEAQLADQPVAGFSWSPDKQGLGLCVSFDQKIRTVIVTKLNTI